MRQFAEAALDAGMGVETTGKAAEAAARVLMVVSEVPAAACSVLCQMSCRYTNVRLQMRSLF